MPFNELPIPLSHPTRTGAHPWYNLYSGAQYAAGTQQTLPAPVEERLPALLRGGHIVPRRERVRRSTAAQFWDPITLVVCSKKTGNANNTHRAHDTQVGLDTAGQAAGDLYLDDTHSFEYQQGAFVHKQYKFEKNILQSLTFDDASPYGKKVCPRRCCHTHTHTHTHLPHHSSLAPRTSTPRWLSSA